jgi:hypothetical protein
MTHDSLAATLRNHNYFGIRRDIPAQNDNGRLEHEAALVQETIDKWLVDDKAVESFFAGAV